MSNTKPIGMPLVDAIAVDTRDMNNLVGVAFSVGDGEGRLRYGVLLTPAQAAVMAHDLVLAYNRCTHKPSATITIPPGVMDGADV